MPPALFRSTIIVSEISGFPSRMRDHFGSTSQSIFAPGKVSRSAAAAGRVCTISPSDPRRTRRNLSSGMWRLAQPGEQVARRMILRVTYNRDLDAQQLGDVALRHRSRRIVGSLGMHVWLQISQ